MSHFSPDDFADRIGKLESEAWEQVILVHSLQSHPGYEEEYRDAAYRLTFMLEQFALSVRVALCAIGAGDLAKELQGELGGESARSITEVTFDAEFDVPHSWALSLISKYSNALLYCLDVDPGVSHRQRELGDLLRKTRSILIAFGTDPSDEGNVDETLLRFLRLLYKDVTNKPDRPQGISGYIPDTGVISLRALIEYKYIDSQRKLSTAIDEIKADVPAYGGSRDWKVFYAVLYMTDQWATEEEVLHRFSDLPPSWRIIIVHGKGDGPAERKAKKQAGADKRKPG